jgi:ABC-type spermidine/putrescine transport system permease subunit II
MVEFLEQKLRPTRWMQMRRRYRALLQKISITALAIPNVVVGFGCLNAEKK